MKKHAGYSEVTTADCGGKSDHVYVRVNQEILAATALQQTLIITLHLTFLQYIHRRLYFQSM
jgi:hypothetical protein